MKFGTLSDLMRLVGVDAHIDPLLLAFGKERRGGRPRAAVSAEGALWMRHTPCGCCPPDLTAEYFDYLASLPKSHLHRVFGWLKMRFARSKPLGKIQEGGHNPLLGRFKGIPKGEIEIPLWRFLFTASGFFFAAQRKRG